MKRSTLWLNFRVCELAREDAEDCVWRPVLLPGAPETLLAQRAVVAGLPEEDVRFLVAASRCGSIVKKRKVAELVPPPVLPRADARESQMVVPQAAEDLLTKPPVSNLDIAGCGPRAAGKLLLRSISEGLDRRRVSSHLRDSVS